MTVGEFLETLEIRRTNETFSPLDLILEGKWDSVIDGLTLTVSVAVQCFLECSQCMNLFSLNNGKFKNIFRFLSAFLFKKTGMDIKFY